MRIPLRAGFLSFFLAVAFSGPLLPGTPAAYAVQCGDGTLAFSGGEGTPSNPFLISNQDDLEDLRDGWNTTPSYYSCAYQQTSDITITRTWEHGLGFSTPASALYKPFEGIYDGRSFVITNLAIDSSTVTQANQARELGFIGLSTSGAASVRNVNLANVNITCGYETQFASMLVGQISGSVERSSASGIVLCTASNNLPRMGGLIGYTNGPVSNAWVAGTITLPTTWSFQPYLIGGVVGKSDTGSSLNNVLGRVSIVNYSQGYYVGAFAGDGFGSGSGNYVQSGLTSGLTDLVARSVVPPLNAEFKSASALQNISTYVGWSISAGKNSGTIWGIDPAINGGYPFLQELAGSDSSSAGAWPTITIRLDTHIGSCTQSDVDGVQGSWVQLPTSMDCQPPTANPNATLLGWSNNQDFSVEIAQRQVNNGWGAYETFDHTGHLTGVFIPAGGKTLLSTDTSLTAIWSD